MGVELGTEQCDLSVKRPSLPGPRRMGARCAPTSATTIPKPSVAIQQASGARVANVSSTDDTRWRLRDETLPLTAP